MSWLKKRLEELNKTQYKLAQETGLARSTISRIAKGEFKTISLTTLEKLANGLAMTPGELADYIKNTQ